MPRSAPKKCNRRAPEDLVAALEAMIESIHVRAVRKRQEANAAMRGTVSAVRRMATDQGNH
jgi:hypothetical protein